MSNEEREDIINAIESLGGGWEQQAFGTRLSVLISADLTQAERQRLISGITVAVVTDNAFDAQDELVTGWSGAPSVFRQEMTEALRVAAPLASDTDAVARVIERLTHSADADNFQGHQPGNTTHRSRPKANPSRAG